MKSTDFYSNYLKLILTVYTALGQIPDTQFNMLIFKKIYMSYKTKNNNLQQFLRS